MLSLPPTPPPKTFGKGNRLTGNADGGYHALPQRLGVEANAMSTIKIKGAQVVPTASNTSDGATGTDAPISAWYRTAEAENDYSPEKFYVKATDYQGHGERIATKVPPELYAQIMRDLVYNEDLPDYDTPQAVMRDALVHLLALRATQLGGTALKASLHAYMRILGLLEWGAQVKRESEAWDQLSEDIDSSLATLLKDKAFAQMGVTLDRYTEFAEGIPEPYQSKAFNAIDEWREKIPKVVTESD